MTWETLNTQQRNELIKSVYQPGMTAREIGMEVGASKNSICGHYLRNRIDLEEYPLPMSAHEKGRRGIISEEHHKRLIREENRTTAAPPIVPIDAGTRFHSEEIPSTADDGLFVTLLENTGCMWPLNDGGPYLFCGHVKFRGSYCQHHVIRSRGVGTESERRAHKIGERHVAC